MKAEELRIGNYVSTIYPKFNYEKVKEIKEKVVYTDNIKGIGYISLKPIPLTEEVLLKCGFKHKGNGFYEILGYFIELCNVGDEFYYCGFKGKSIGNIKHLHQLQNLYYCLTGKELNIEL